MHELKRYRIDYRLNGQPASLILDEFHEPTLDQVRLRLLHEHTREPRVVEDAPWEQNCRPSLESRADEIGLSDIRIQPLT
ncbi:hypothetical protein [Pseudomonas indica]|uniref:hypothetical protein n=1 Tax=Pseudomonas indica TaxID=137658 RepID=UPI000BAB95D9|nr:hypothetical protein [Pseudomonas indica]MBU3055425.1 hypothetical protein [Pseudomonas indica]PAU62421.1 hypothetical protein BZL42_06155 [Pseudomonas indica]